MVRLEGESTAGDGSQRGENQHRHITPPQPGSRERSGLHYKKRRKTFPLRHKRALQTCSKNTEEKAEAAARCDRVSPVNGG